VAGLTWAQGEYRSVKGPVRVAWKMDGGKTKLSVELPKGVSARVWLADQNRWVQVGAGKHAW